MLKIFCDLFHNFLHFSVESDNARGMPVGSMAEGQLHVGVGVEHRPEGVGRRMVHGAPPVSGSGPSAADRATTREMSPV